MFRSFHLWPEWKVCTTGKSYTNVACPGLCLWIEAYSVICEHLPETISELSVEVFCGGVEGGVSQGVGLIFTAFIGVLWKQPSTHFRRLLTGESSTVGSALVTHWTDRTAWKRITGFVVVLLGKLSTVFKLKVFLVCCWVSTFAWMFSFLSSLSLCSVKQIKLRGNSF